MKVLRAAAILFAALPMPLSAQIADLPARPVDQSAQGMSTLAAEVVDANPRVQAQRQVVDQLRARLSAARSGRLPSLEGNALVERRRLSIHGGPGDQDFTIGQGDLEARLPLFDGGRVSAAVAIAKAELANGEAVLDSLIEEVLLDLVTAAADLGQARAVQVLVQQQRGAIEGELNATRNRLQVRDATATDVAQAEARLAASEATLLEAQEQFAGGEAQFEAITGRPAAQVPALPDLPGGPPTLEDATVRAAQDAPVVRAARTAADAGRSAISSAEAALAPNVEAVAGYQYLAGGVANLFTGRLPNDRSATYGGVSARIPIFQRGAEYAEIRRAKALTGQREFQVQQSVREVTRDLELAWARRRAAAGVSTAARTAVVANEKALRGVTRESQLGARTVLDVLDAQLELLSAQITEQRAQRSEYVARATVLSTLGQLRPALIAPRP